MFQLKSVHNLSLLTMEEWTNIDITNTSHVYVAVFSYSVDDPRHLTLLPGDNVIPLKQNRVKFHKIFNIQIYFLVLIRIGFTDMIKSRLM